MTECPVCRAREVEQERLEAERNETRDAANKNREMMKKWREYIQGLPAYHRFSFEVMENGIPLGAMWADADAETEEQARAKLEKYIEENGGGITLGKLRWE